MTLTGSALYAIIDGYTREAGVRNLERTITSAPRKCAQKIAAGEAEKISVSAAMVKELLGPEKVKPTFIPRKDAVGIATVWRGRVSAAICCLLRSPSSRTAPAKSRSPAASVMS